MAGCVVFEQSTKAPVRSQEVQDQPEEACGMFSAPLVLRMQDGLINRAACPSLDSASSFGPYLKGQA